MNFLPERDLEIEIWEGQLDVKAGELKNQLDFAQVKVVRDD
jgi:hypothetical protein